MWSLPIFYQKSGTLLNQAEPRFLRQQAELRNKIYDVVIAGHTIYITLSLSGMLHLLADEAPMALDQTSRQLQQETYSW